MRAYMPPITEIHLIYTYVTEKKVYLYVHVDKSHGALLDRVVPPPPQEAGAGGGFCLRQPPIRHH